MLISKLVPKAKVAQVSLRGKGNLDSLPEAEESPTKKLKLGKKKADAIEVSDDSSTSSDLDDAMSRVIMLTGKNNFSSRIVPANHSI